MATNFDFASSDPEAMILYDEAVQRDAERFIWQDVRAWIAARPEKP